MSTLVSFHAPLATRDSGVRRAGRGGFTLIEVLVVVAILALLVSILLPSLAKARENGRAAQCLSNLKQTGTAISFYVNDNRSSLPGPSHPLIFVEQFDEQYKNSLDAQGDQYGYESRWFRRQSLLNFLRRYFEKGKSGSLTDQISKCPTNAAIIKVSLKNLMQTGDYSPTSAFRPYTYFLNTWRAAPGGNVKNRPPYHGTKPPFYFGIIYHGTTYKEWTEGTFASFSLAERVPKKIDVVERTSREWSVADAWYGEYPESAAGTWPQKEGSSTSLSPKGNMTVPGWPFHYTTRQYPLNMDWVKTHINRGDPRFTDGKTNALYFDSHVESVRLWKGAGNPCYAGDTSCGG